LGQKKNRKIAVRNRHDVDTYRNDPSYKYSVEMADLFIDKLQNLGKDKETQLQTFIEKTGLTLNFEFESTQYQHVVPLVQNKLVLIGCSGFHLGGKAVHPVLPFAFSQYFDFTCVFKKDDFKEYDKSELDTVCERVKSKWQTEGYVLVLLNKFDRVIDLVKVKSTWYVLLRAIREKTKQKELSVDNMKERLTKLKKTMGLNPQFTDKFISIAKIYFNWIRADKSQTRKQQAMSSFPKSWMNFLTTHSLPLDESLLNAKIRDI